MRAVVSGEGRAFANRARARTHTRGQMCRGGLSWYSLAAALSVAVRWSDFEVDQFLWLVGSVYLEMLCGIIGPDRARFFGDHVSFCKIVEASLAGEKGGSARDAHCCCCCSACHCRLTIIGSRVPKMSGAEREDAGLWTA